MALCHSCRPRQRTQLTSSSFIWFLCAGQPLELVKPEILRHKVFEPILIMGANKVKNLDIRLRVKGGGHVSQVYGECAGGMACRGWGWHDACEGPPCRCMHA